MLTTAISDSGLQRYMQYGQLSQLSWASVFVCQSSEPCTRVVWTAVCIAQWLNLKFFCFIF